jgi:uncharacterized protein (TIGR02266 family)
MRNERRESSRTELSVSVSYRINNQDREEAYQVESVNISEGGVFLKTDLPLGLGTKVKLELSLPQHRETIRFCGKVVWSGGAKTEEGGQVSGKGIEFVDCDAGCMKQLREYLEQYR